MIDTTHKNVHFKNQINGKITSSGVIDKGKINPRGLCYQCYKDIPDYLFGELIIRYPRDEPHFAAKIKLLSSQIQMNTLFNNKDEIKIRICDRNIHKSMWTPVVVYKIIKALCYSSTKKCM